MCKYTYFNIRRKIMASVGQKSGAQWLCQFFDANIRKSILYRTIYLQKIPVIWYISITIQPDLYQIETTLSTIHVYYCLIKFLLA